jgi:hypothetical protein
MSRAEVVHNHEKDFVPHLRARPSRRFILQWSMASLIAFSLFFMVLLSPQISVWNVYDSFSPIIATPVLAAAVFAYGALIISMAQWLILRKWVAHMGWWILATLIGTLLGTLVAIWQSNLETIHILTCISIPVVLLQTWLLYWCGNIAWTIWLTIKLLFLLICFWTSILFSALLVVPFEWIFSALPDYFSIPGMSWLGTWDLLGALVLGFGFGLPFGIGSGIAMWLSLNLGATASPATIS